MKRFLTILLTATTLLCSCMQNPEVDTNIASTPFSFYVDFDGTRIEFSDENRYCWEGDEVLGTYITSTATTINVPASVTLKDGRAICNTMVSGINSGDKLRVYYPWNELNDMNSFENITVTIPTVQKQAKAGDFNVEYMPMVGSTITTDASAAPTVYMRPIAGFIRVNVYSSTATTEKLLSVAYTDTNTAIAGNCSVDMTQIDTTGSIEINGSANSVTLSVAEPYTVVTSLAQTKSLYMVLAPSRAEGTLRVTTDKAIYTYPNYSTNIERNKYYDLNIDLSKATVRQAIESEWGGGDGSISNPYIIRTAEDIVRLSEGINSSDYTTYYKKYYRQVCDIDMSGIVINSIGAISNRAFQGHYDGGGFTISNATITQKRTSTPCALFGYTSDATICNLTVKDFTINSSDIYQSALVGYAENTTIDNCTFEGKSYFTNLYSGGLIGHMDGGVISHCRIEGRVENNVNGITLGSETNVAYTAGVVGYAINGALIEDCTLAGDVATMGRYAAGIVSRIDNSTVRNCTVLNTAEVSNVSHYCGGIVALMTGNDSLVDGCRFEGRVNTSYPIAGAIVGSVTAGKVTNSISTRTSFTTSYEGYSGGIVGQIYTATASDIAIIDHCAAYGQVEGAYNIGGIVGYIYHPVAGAYAGITNCAVVGSKLISRGANSNGYNLVGGLAGWLKGSGTIVIAACSARPYEVHGAPISKGTTTKELISGLVACFDSCGIVMDGCYTDLARTNTLWGFEPIAVTTSGTVRHGALFGYSYNNAAVNSCYCGETLPIHGSVGSGKSVTTTNCSIFAPTQMTDGTLLASLNAASAAYTPATNTPAAARWVAGVDGYPIPEGLPTDTTPANAEPKKVSVIGDSISTFRGYIPYSYSTYYPRTDGTFISVADMYWYQLIYKHMTNARLERNIAYSGSWVTKADTSKDTYFAKRFIDQNGVGDADIVIIHGGTNDWNKNAVNLVSGLGVRATSGPTDAQLQPLFAAADAAKTRAEVEALNDTTFCEAYIKLIKLVIDRNPNVKIVCLIGDYVGVGVELATLKLAEHFPNNCRSVDLRAVNGFNDQTYMPKLYYSSTNTGQCHPNQKAMAFIAEKIYKELGSWLEE